MQTSDGNTNDTCSKTGSLRQWLTVFGYSLFLIILIYVVTNYSDDFLRWCIDGRMAR